MPVLPVVLDLVEQRVPLELEADIDALAIAARGDAEARNRLYLLLSHKARRFAGPLHQRFADVGEPELSGICLLVFAELVLDWSGEGSFVRYFLGFYRWRLRHVVEREERRARRLVRIGEDFPDRCGEGRGPRA